MRTWRTCSPPTRPASTCCTRSSRPRSSIPISSRYDEQFVTRCWSRTAAASAITAIDARTGEMRAITAKAVILATGGAGRIFPFTTNAMICTGDGMALAYRAGVAAGGHGVRAVPSHRPARHRHPDHRGVARRGRVPAQQGRRTLPGAVRSRTRWSLVRATCISRADDHRVRGGPRASRARTGCTSIWTCATWARR